jgi:glycerophosphoryl diester phosphodiesterase
VGSWFARRALPSSPVSSAVESLPLLSQVFDFFSQQSGVLYLEMKCDTQEGPILAAQVVRLIREYQFADRVVVESFDLPTILEVKRIDAGIRTAALFEPKLTHPISTLRRLKMVDRALQFQANEIALHYSLVGAAVVESAHQHGLDVVVWTVDELSWVERARSLGVKALIANDPGKLVEYRLKPRA